MVINHIEKLNNNSLKITTDRLNYRLRGYITFPYGILSIFQTMESVSTLPRVAPRLKVQF